MTELTIDQALQQGIEAHKAGELQKADRIYSAILKAQPKHPDANHNMGVLAVGVGKVQEALPFFKTALEANPATAQFWLSYIDTLIKLDKLADAKAVLDQAKSKGAKGDGFDQLEQRLIEVGQEPLEANQIVSEPQSEQPNILDTLKLDKAIELAKKKAKDGSYDEAKRVYQDILTKFPKNKRARDGIKALARRPVGKTSKVQDPPKEKLQSLIYLYSQGKLAAVIEQAKALTKQYPEAFTVWNLIGASAAQIGQLDQAIFAFKRVLAIKPDYAEAYNNMGNALQEQGKLEEAIEVYTKALAIKPDYAEAHYNMGVTLKEQGKLEEAIQAYNKALAIKPDYAEAYYNMGVTLKEQGKLEEAIEAYHKALAIKPDYAEAYSNMGNALQYQGKPEGAIEAYSKAIAIKPDYAEAHYNMGVTLKEQGKLEEAIQAYNKALAIKPDYAEAYYNMGNVLKDQVQLEEAIEAYNKAFVIKSDYAEAYNNMGVTLQEQGKLEEAIEAYNKALAVKPDYTEVYSNMGVTLQDQGKLEEAEEAFRKDGSIKSQTHLLKCLYKLDKPAKFYDQLKYLVDEGVNNAVIGSYISRSQIKYGIKRTNPFCNDPLRYTFHTNLTSRCKFKDVFIDGATEVLASDKVQNRPQNLLTNGIQTTGNVFNQMGSFSVEIQNILRLEIENYRMCFNESQEGLIKSWPSDYELRGWLVSMKNGGKLAAHMHDNGWISGSVYINVPPKVNKDSGNFVVCLDNEQESQSIDVITGSLCLFPSSLLHYTIPFEADENRIVLAFDVIPK